MVRVARRRIGPLWPPAAPGAARQSAGAGLPARGDAPFHGHHALHQHHSGRPAAGFPGNREIERRIKSIIRWNAMAMVVRAKKHSGIGGHISTFASPRRSTRSGSTISSTARGTTAGDFIYFQGHASPGIYCPGVHGRPAERERPSNNFRRNWRPAAGCPRIRTPG